MEEPTTTTAAATATTSNGSTLPFVLSLLSVIFLCVPVFGAIIAVVLGITGLTLTMKAKKVDSSSLLTAASVLSVIGIAIGGIELLFIVIAVGFFSTAAGSYVHRVFETPFF